MEVVEKKKELVPILRFNDFEGSWEETTVKNVFSFFNGYAFSSKDSCTNGVRWIKIADVGVDGISNKNLSFLPSNYIEKHKKFLLKEGDYVVALTRPILNGKLKIAQVTRAIHNSLLNQRVGKIESKHNLDFIYSFLQQNKVVSNIENRIAGTDPPNLSPSEINGIKVAFPTLPEQQKIAAFLSAVDEKIQQLTQKKALLEQYKKGVMQKLFPKKAGQAPELRFKKPDGSNYPDWEEKVLSNLAERVTQKNKVDNQNVLTISAQLGLVSQLEYFNKSVAANNLTGYYLLDKNDFAYNKSYSAGYPMGAIKRLKLYEKGVVSTLYICFRFNDRVNLDFMEQYFEFGLQVKELEKVAQEGARNHGLLNIGVKDFFNILITTPTKEEQQKIADFLSGIDQKINQVETQINQTQTFKKGLLQQMFV